MTSRGLLQDHLTRVAELAKESVRLLRQAATFWCGTAQDLWRWPGICHKGTAAAMTLVALLAALRLAYVLLWILPLIALGVLGVIFIRAAGRNLGR